MRTATVTIMKHNQGEYHLSDLAMELIAKALVQRKVRNVRFDQVGTVKKAWVEDKKVRADVEFLV